MFISKLVVLLVLGFSIGISIKITKTQYLPFNLATVQDVALFVNHDDTKFYSQLTVLNATSNSFEYKNLSSVPMGWSTDVQGDLVWIANLISSEYSNVELYNSTSNELSVLLENLQRIVIIPYRLGCLLFVSLNGDSSGATRIALYNITTTKMTSINVTIPLNTLPIVIGDKLYFSNTNGTFSTYSLTTGVQGEYNTKYTPSQNYFLTTTDLLVSFYTFTNSTSTLDVSVVEIYNTTSESIEYLYFNSSIFSKVGNTLFYNNHIFLYIADSTNHAVTINLNTKSYSITPSQSSGSFYLYLSTVWKFDSYSVQYYDMATSSWNDVPLPIYGYFTYLFVNDTLVFSGVFNTTSYVPQIHFYNVIKQTWSYINTSLYLIQSQLSMNNNQIGIIYGGDIYNGTSIVSSSDILTLIRCSSDEDCDDFLFCNGQEYCENGFCSSSNPPCNPNITCNAICNEEDNNCYSPAGSDCDNNKRCDGIDTCDGSGNCVHSGNPCLTCQTCQELPQPQLCYNSTKGTSCPGNGTCDIFICDGLGSCNAFELSTCVDKTAGNTTKNNSTFLAIIFGSVLGAVVLIAMVGLLVFFLVKRKKKTSSENRGSIEMSLAVIDNVKKLERIGSGEFGDVYRGYLDDTIEVALKTLKASDFSSNDFQREIGLLRSLNHPNIVRLYGLYHSADNERFMVLEYMSKGSLLTLLHESKSSIDSYMLLQMAKQIVAGMKYLEANNVIHRDLALRNILASVDDRGNYIVKVGDFGMSRVLETSYYKTDDKRMPIKWSAPEFIQYGKSTSKSDVWSFGICLWELFSYGVVPYVGWSNNVVIKKVVEGYRMSSPANCPEVVYALMMECWSFEPESRPAFSQLSQKITQIIDQTENKPKVEESKYQNVDLKHDVFYSL